MPAPFVRSLSSSQKVSHTNSTSSVHPSPLTVNPFYPVVPALLASHLYSPLPNPLFYLILSLCLSPGSSNTSNFPLSSSARNPQLSSSSSSSLSLSSTHYNTNIHNPTSFSVSSPPSSSSSFSSQSDLPVVNPINCFPSLSPSKSLNAFYFNARSLLPKFDDLLLFCASYSPDIICVVETWLSPEISDSEVSIPNYLLFRLDRSRHGAGIAVFIKSTLSVSPLPFAPNLNSFPF